MPDILSGYSPTLEFKYFKIQLFRLCSSCLGRQHVIYQNDSPCICMIDFHDIC